MTFETIINSINTGDIDTLTPYLLKQLGDQYLNIIKDQSKNYGYKSIAKALITFANENPYTSSENCVDQLIHSIACFNNFNGILANHIIILLNRTLNTNIRIMYNHRYKSNLELADEFYHVLLNVIKTNMTKQIQPNMIASINVDLIRYFSTKYLERAAKRPYFHLNNDLANQLLRFANENTYACEKQCIEQLIKTLDRNTQPNHSWLNECIIYILNQIMKVDKKLTIANNKAEIINQYYQKLNQIIQTKPLLID
ncbi:MAG: hypothetical protein EP298_04310 [Gammaproteobacteria bacterium]|nr:MAG: hypothetical protein EP298_04310 [Gammaproteobacteria bacterium]UTW43853.1 hypothetical protein KFE69_07120 [bacterium SCSIO 12844]